jgi:hypothetical protein
MLQKFLLLTLLLILNINLSATDKLKMKAGNYMSGEVMKVTDKGILFKMDGMEKIIEFLWDVIDDECKSTLVAKYGISKPEVAVIEEPKKVEEKSVVDKKVANGAAQIPEVKEPIEINYNNLSKTLFASYMSNLKSLILETIDGVEYTVAEGVIIKTKVGKIFRGIEEKENPKEPAITTLKYNELPIVLQKEDIVSKDNTLLKIKKGKLDYANMQKYVETSLHENCLKLAASEEGIRYDQAKYIWGLRTSGGTIPTESGEKKFLPYKTNRSIDLLDNSFLFADKNAASNLKTFPVEDWWNSQQLTSKENILMAIIILKNFPKIDWIDKPCSACKGEGVMKTKDTEKDAGKDKTKTKETKTTKPKGKEDAGKDKTCTACHGIKKAYSLKYE